MGYTVGGWRKVYKDESGAVTTSLSSRSAVALGLKVEYNLPSWSTTAALKLLSAIVYPLLQPSSNYRMTSAKMSIRPTSLFQSD